MTSHLDSHKTTDIKTETLSGVKTGNGTLHGKYSIRGIAHARTNRKDDIFMRRRLVHTALDIFRFAAFLQSKRIIDSTQFHTWGMGILFRLISLGIFKMIDTFEGAWVIG